MDPQLPKATGGGESKSQGEAAAVHLAPLEHLDADTLRRGVSPSRRANQVDRLVEDDRSGMKPSDPARKLAE